MVPILTCILICTGMALAAGLLVAPQGERRWCASVNDYIHGSWVLGDSANFSFPYTQAPQPEWQPRCDATQEEVLKGGAIPKYLLQQWKPSNCDLEQFDRLALCKRLDGKIIGVAGDSTSQHFVISLAGLMLGHVGLEWTTQIPFRSPPQPVELCGKTPYSVGLSFVRQNDWPTKDWMVGDHRLEALFRQSDILVLNWGPWYRDTANMTQSVRLQADNVVEQGSHVITELMESLWSPKPASNVFWRASIAFTPGCTDILEPLASVDDPRIYADEPFNSGQIYKQERDVVWPKLQAAGATILRTDAFTMLRADGHKVVGHDGVVDCLHYCEPGPPDAWSQLFFHYMMGHVPRP